MRLAQLLQVSFIVLSGIGVYSFVSAAKDGERRNSCTAVCALRPDYAGFDRLAPDFELESLDGRKLRLSDFRGKVVVMNFWTKTCRPCLEEMPSLADFGRILSRASDRIVLLTVTTDEDAADARATLGSVIDGETQPFLTVVDAENAIVSGKYGTKLYPETWFIDPKGVIRARFDGPRDWTNALYLELAESLSSPSSCAVDFDRGKPVGATGARCAGIPVFGG